MEEKHDTHKNWKANEKEADEKATNQSAKASTKGGLSMNGAIPFRTDKAAENKKKKYKNVPREAEIYVDFQVL